MRVVILSAKILLALSMCYSVQAQSPNSTQIIAPRKNICVITTRNAGFEQRAQVVVTADDGLSANYFFRNNDNQNLGWDKAVSSKISVSSQHMHDPKKWRPSRLRHRVSGIVHFYMFDDIPNSGKRDDDFDDYIVKVYEIDVSGSCI